MSDNQYIKKRQRQRNRSFITTRSIITLIVISGLIYLGFYSEYGGVNDLGCDGDCESEYGIGLTIFAFFLMFAAVIGLGALTGIGLAKWNSRKKPSIYQTDTDQKE